MNLIVSCSYYNVKSVTTTPDTIANSIDSFAKSQKYAVIHSGMTIWHLSQLEVNEQQKTMSGIAKRLDVIHIPKKPRESKTTHRYNGKKEVLNEVHFYVTTKSTVNYGERITIPFSEINSISINDLNSGRTIINIVLGTIGVLAVLAIIVALTKSSCPFIYVNDGGEYIFTGELYPGVLTANQQRDDYLLLPKIDETNGTYCIKITNELKEIQYTDFVQLLEVNHPKNTKVLLDKNGNPHSYTDIISPIHVSLDNLKSDSAPALLKDNSSFMFDTKISGTSSTRYIELQFKKPPQADQGKLFLTAKNSLWLDYVFGKFNAQFGTYYNQFQKDQQKASKEKSTKWMNDQNIPLSVYLKTNNGWELVERINTVGPMAFRDLAVPIDLKGVKGEDLTIKLESGFMFWEIDYVGMDFTKDLPLHINYINPDEAVDGNNNIVTKLLSFEDQNYFVQPHIGDEVIVNFKIHEPQPELNRTFFLKNRGYYNYIRNYTDEPNFQNLKLFRKAGAFTDFSKFEYDALMDYESQFDLASQSN